MLLSCLRMATCIGYVQAGIAPLDAQLWRTADLVVVLGGPISVYETQTYPWLAEELAMIEQRLANHQPTLGICLGAQLIAMALGAKVYACGIKEIGWPSIELTVAGLQSPLKALQSQKLLHWHGDTFDLPSGATLLASTALTKHQAFSYGETVLALQFHPEAESEQIEKWLVGHTCELNQAKVDIASLRAESQRINASSKAAGQAMLKDWLPKIMR